MESEGEQSATQAVLKYNDDLKLIYNYDNYIGFVKANESVINYIRRIVKNSDGEKKRH